MVPPCRTPNTTFASSHRRQMASLSSCAHSAYAKAPNSPSWTSSFASARLRMGWFRPRRKAQPAFIGSGWTSSMYSSYRRRFGSPWFWSWRHSDARPPNAPAPPQTARWSASARAQAEHDPKSIPNSLTSTICQPPPPQAAGGIGRRDRGVRGDHFPLRLAAGGDRGGDHPPASRGQGAVRRRVYRRGRRRKLCDARHAGAGYRDRRQPHRCQDGVSSVVVSD